MSLLEAAAFDATAIDALSIQCRSIICTIMNSPSRPRAPRRRRSRTTQRRVGKSRSPPDGPSRHSRGRTGSAEYSRWVMGCRPRPPVEARDV